MMLSLKQGTEACQKAYSREELLSGDNSILAAGQKRVSKIEPMDSPAVRWFTFTFDPYPYQLTK